MPQNHYIFTVHRQKTASFLKQALSWTIIQLIYLPSFCFFSSYNWRWVWFCVKWIVNQFFIERQLSFLFCLLIQENNLDCRWL